VKVLLSAYACRPRWGSEPAVGWNWVQQVARFHEVWVMTHTSNRAAIERELLHEGSPNVHWVYFGPPRWARFRQRGLIGIRLNYRLWQIKAYFIARKLHAQFAFDIAHHVTLGQYWTPSLVALLPIPFVWGPVGGGESAPASFRSGFALRGRVFETLRDLARNLASIDPWMKRLVSRSGVAIATTEETASRLRLLGRTDVLIIPQYAMTTEERMRLGSLSFRQTNPFRLISMGRLIHWKGFHLSLRAFAQFHARCPDSEYWIVNDGPEGRRLKALATELGVRNKVVFWGKLPSLQDVYAKLADCDVLVHPALHEAFGNVCLEAMAAGRPVICLDLGGPALQVTEETGIKVPAISPDQAVHDLAGAMVKLATDPELRARMGQAARQRVKESFDWDKKGDLIDQMYLTMKTGDKLDHPLTS